MKYRKLNLDPWQKEFLATKGDKILCCGRQVGKTEIAGMDAGEWAVKNPEGHPVLMIAPTERQANALFNKTLDYLTNRYPNHIKMGVDRPTKTKITLKSGMRIFCLPTGVSGIGIRFLTVGRLYRDECSRIPEEVHDAVDPMLMMTGGDTIDLSTPFGAVGEFFRIFINKNKAYDSYKRFSVTSEEVIRNREICATWTEKQRDKALMKIEQAKKRKSKKVFAQEYLGEFIEDLHRYFSDRLIAKCCVLKRRKMIIPNREYYMGCDIARMGEDKGTYEIFDKKSRDNIEQVENIVTRKKKTWETEEKICALNMLWNFVYKKSIGIDAGSGTLGVSVLDHLLRIDSVKRKIVALNNRGRSLNYDGNKKTSMAKEDYYDNMRSMMEMGVVKFLDDENIIESLRSIQFEHIMKEGQFTRMKIFGAYEGDADIVEGIMRALELAKDKNLNIQLSWV